MAAVGTSPTSPLGMTGSQPRPPSGSRGSSRARQSLSGTKLSSSASALSSSNLQNTSVDQLTATLTRTLQKQPAQSTSSMLYAKAVNALTSEEIIAPDGGDNRVRALTKTAKQIASGLKVREAVLVADVLAAARGCLVKASKPTGVNVSEIRDGVVAILNAIMEPLVVGKSSESWVESKGIIALLNEIAAFLKVNHREVILAVVKTLETLYNPKATMESGDEIDVGSLESLRAFFKSQFPLSDIPSAMLSALLYSKSLDDELNKKKSDKDHEDDSSHSASTLAKDSLFQSVLTFARQLTSNKSIALLMLESPELPALLPLLPKLYTTNYFYVFVELLWDLFEIEQIIAEKNEQSKIDQLAKPTCIAALGETLRIVMINARDGQPLKQIRNDVLVLVSLISSNSKCAPIFVDNHVLEQIVRYVTCKSHPSHHPDVKKIHLTQCTEDFELHKILVSTATRLSVISEKAMKVSVSGNLLSMLFSYLDTKPMAERKRAWSDAQYEELQLQALCSLAVLIPHALEEYQSLRGNTQLLKFLEWTAQPVESSTGVGLNTSLQDTTTSLQTTSDFSLSAISSGTVSRSGNGRRTHACLCLRVLISVAIQGDLTINRDLSDQGALTQLIDLFESYSVNNDRLDLRMRTDAILVCSALCQDDSHNKELFGASGVQAIIPYLKYDPNAIDANSYQEDLLVAAIDCISNCIVGCRLTEQTFLEEEGVFHLLDILSVCHQRHQRIVLSTLVDLCETEKALAHTRLWRHRDDDSFNISHLLIGLWREEMQRMKVDLESGCLLSDRVAPLMGEDQMCMPVSSGSDAEDASPAISDVYNNNRANIYALFSMLGIEGIVDSLEPEQQVTLAIIDSYLSLKRGEVWMELAEELTADGIQPVDEDQEILRLACEANKDVIEQVRLMQKEILSVGEAETLGREKTEYEGLKQQLRDQEKAKADFESFVRRTKDFEALRTAKRDQLAAIDKSRVN